MQLANMAAMAAFLVAGVACASTQEPAPGTAPGDMSAEEHSSEADEHDAMADEHRDEAQDSTKAPEAMEHNKEAKEHSDVADQHDAAAEEAGK
jgi:hypothetical protein